MWEVWQDIKTQDMKTPSGWGNLSPSSFHLCKLCQGTTLSLLSPDLLYTLHLSSLKFSPLHFWKCHQLPPTTTLPSYTLFLFNPHAFSSASPFAAISNRLFLFHLSFVLTIHLFQPQYNTMIPIETSKVLFPTNPRTVSKDVGMKKKTHNWALILKTTTMRSW